MVLTRESRISVAAPLVLWFFEFFVAATPLGYASGLAVKLWFERGRRAPRLLLSAPAVLTIGGVGQVLGVRDGPDRYGPPRFSPACREVGTGLGIGIGECRARLRGPNGRHRRARASWRPSSKLPSVAAGRCAARRSVPPPFRVWPAKSSPVRDDVCVGRLGSQARVCVAAVGACRGVIASGIAGGLRRALGCSPVPAPAGPVAGVACWCRRPVPEGGGATSLRATAVLTAAAWTASNDGHQPLVDRHTSVRRRGVPPAAFGP